MTNVRCAVLGAGWWATYAHIPALLKHPRADLVAIHRHDLEQARQVASHFGIPKAFDSVEDVLSQDLDAVVVSSSPNQHYADAAAALRRGLHVLIEKPMTIRASEAHELERLAEEKGRTMIISCPWHYTPHGQKARALIRRGELGEIRMVSMLMTNPVDGLIRGTNLNPTYGTPYLKPRPGTYSDPAIAGGGQIYTQVSHAAAYLTFLTGLNATQVFARFHNDGSHMDIYDSLSIVLENGCLASIASTGATPESERNYEVRVFGSEGILFLELWQGTMRTVQLKTGLKTEYASLLPHEIYPEHAPATNLIDSVLKSDANLSPGSLGVAAMDVIEAACESARFGNSVNVSRQRRLTSV